MLPLDHAFTIPKYIMGGVWLSAFATSPVSCQIGNELQE
jgi:hypothetical protein